MPTQCNVHNCTRAAVAKGLCGTHYKRTQRHGDLRVNRPNDWGERHKHPAYNSWAKLRRYYSGQMCERWREDFWAFVDDVPPKPPVRCTACRERPDEPFSKDNFYWREPILDRTKLDANASYMREWHRNARAKNPDYYRNKDLRKNYGVTLEWYNGQLAKQNGVCAICDKPETAIIHGKQISLAVDHCHDTGKVRGLLCRACNNAIGALEHSPERFKRAIQYLCE